MGLNRDEAIHQIVSETVELLRDGDWRDEALSAIEDAGHESETKLALTILGIANSTRDMSDADVVSEISQATMHHTETMRRLIYIGGLVAGAK